MHVSRLSPIFAVGGLLIICGAVVVVGQELSSISTAATVAKPSPAVVQEAQVPQAASTPVQEAQAQPRTPPPAPAQPSAPRRIETTEYNNWVVTCEETGGAAKPSCVASLRMRNQNGKLLLEWQIGFNPSNHYVTAIHIPPALATKKDDKVIGGPIMVAEGVELKFGNGAARRLSFVSCGPQQCIAEAAIDDVFVKEAVANVEGKASVTVHTAGGVIPFEVPIKGIDKAISSTRR